MLRQLFIILVITLLSGCLFMQTAEARFGGGRSFGMQRSSFSNHSPLNSGAARSAAASPARSWLGPLAGLAVGGLLASLFFGSGLGGHFGWIILIIAGLVLFSLLRSRQRQTGYAPANANLFQNSSNMNTAPSYTPSSNFAPAANNASINFDKDSFLREAKGSFIRLQAAYDAKNSADLRQFTTPQVFAEISLQLQERGDAKSQTDVINLNADLLDVAEENGSKFASVRFSGLIREAENTAPVNFTETWHFQQVADAWLVAGVTQQ